MKKTCATCHKKKLVDEFVRSSRSPGGYFSYCKMCWNIKARQRRTNVKSSVKVGVDIKMCCRCKTSKSIDEFYKNSYTVDGYAVICKVCRKENHRAYCKENRDKVKVKRAEYQVRNRQKISVGNKIRYVNNRTVVLDKAKRYYRTNRETIIKRTSAYVRKRRKIDPAFKLKSLVSREITRALRGFGTGKTSSVWKSLLYTPDQLRAHLESRFEPWMNWSNHGSASIVRRTWHIDHIIPLDLLKFSSFDETNFLKVWSLDNLRPLDANENILKSNKYDWTIRP